MSGNLYFEKTVEEDYELVFDYSALLSPGEVVKNYIVYVDSKEITEPFDARLQEWNDRFTDISGNIIINSGQYNSLVYNVFTEDVNRYDNSTLLVKTHGGIIDSGYTVEVKAVTNRRTEYIRGVDVFINETAYANVYDDLHYKYLVDSNIIYILPAMYINEDNLYVPGFIYNKEYSVFIDRNIESINKLTMLTDAYFWFTSKMCPMFTYASTIIMNLGPEAEKFTSDTINRYIHRVSKEAIDLLNISGSCGGAPRITYDHYGCTPELVPYNLRRYVECKVSYILLNLLDRLRSIDGSASGQTKTLGDLTIKYGGGGSGSGSGSGCGYGPKKDFYDCYTGLEGILSNGANACGTGAGINNGARGLYNGSKGYVHPSQDGHNRISNNKPNANGPWLQNGNTRYPNRRRF